MSTHWLWQERRQRAGGAVSLAVAAACIGLAAPRTASAVTRRDDVPDQSYIDLGNQPQYAAVGALLYNDSASATLVTPKWVLTAGHTTQGSELHTFILGPTTASPDQYHSDLVFNAGFGTLTDGKDIGLIRLDSLVSTTTPASRYFGLDPRTQTATMVGYGLSGVGSSGYVLGTYGTKRAGDNVVDIFGGASIANGFSTNIMFADFDDPGNADNLPGIPGFDVTPLPLEGMIAPGDSGGGAFLTISGRTYLAGVTSLFAAVPPPNGDYNGTFTSINSSYSDVAGMTQVAVYNQWVDDNIVNYWTGSSDSSGSFSGSTNWNLPGGGANLQAVPGNGDIAGFGTLTGNFTVNFSAGATVSNHQLLVRGGNSTINLNGGTYNLTSNTYDGGIVVGRYAGESDASITFVGGTINSHDAILAQQAIVSGKAAPIATLTLGAGATWNVTPDVTTGVTGDLYLGGTFSGAGGNSTLTLATSTSSLNVAGRLRVYAGNRVNYNGGTLSVGTLEMGFGDLNGGRIVLAMGGNKVLQAKSVSFNSGGTGKIDLSDNDMIVDYTGTSPLATIRGYIVSGYAGGAWNGVGINSSSALASQTIGPKTALGYGEASVLGLSSFSGIPVDATTIVIKYTYAGDANLDGMVNIQDLFKLAQDYNTASNWTGADFNYDGLVNSIDLALLAGNWQMGVTSPVLGDLASLSGGLGLPMVPAAVPEPATMTFAPIIVLAAGLRRRRRIS